MKTDDGKVILSVERLKQLRKSVCLSQENLAYQSTEKNTPISIATIKRAESGKQVSYRTARKLAKLYGVSAVDLVATIGTKRCNQQTERKDNNILFKGSDKVKDYNIESHLLTHIYPGKLPNQPTAERKFGLELQQFSNILNGSIISKCAHIVVVTGKCGVGKTFLLEEFHSHAAQLGCKSHYLPTKQLGNNGATRLLSALLGDNNQPPKPTCYAEKHHFTKAGGNPGAIDAHPSLKTSLAEKGASYNQNGRFNTITSQPMTSNEQGPEKPNSINFKKLKVICLDDTQIYNSGIVKELYKLKTRIAFNPTVLVFSSLLDRNQSYANSILTRLNYPITSFFLPSQ